MASRKPTLPLEEQIANMQTVVDGYKSQLAETAVELESMRKRHSETYSAAEKWRKRATELETEVDGLREELHGMTVEKSRLEGYIDRAREFDPEPEQRMVTVPEEMLRHRGKNFDGGGFLDTYGSKERKQPWYKRDI